MCVRVVKIPEAGISPQLSTPGLDGLNGLSAGCRRAREGSVTLKHVFLSYFLLIVVFDFGWLAYLVVSHLVLHWA